MDNEQFDLGEALGGYEQAQADRNFYLSMMQQGQQNRGAFMASPIAAYLAGVSGVKMATMRQKAQAIQDERQAKKDALEAANEDNKRVKDILVQMVTIAKDPNVSPSVKGAMLGFLGKQTGRMVPDSYDADNNIYSYTDPRDGEKFEMDFNEMSQKVEAGVKKAETAAELNVAKKGSEIARKGLLEAQAGLTAAKTGTEIEMLPFKKMSEKAKADFLNKKIDSLPTAKQIADKMAKDIEYKDALINQAAAQAERAKALAAKASVPSSARGEITPSTRLRGFLAANQPIVDAAVHKKIISDLNKFTDENIQGFLDDYEPWMGMDSAYNAVVAYVLNEQKKEKPSRLGINIPVKDFSKTAPVTEEVSILDFAYPKK